MNTAKKLKTTKPKVIFYLRSHKYALVYRDNDEALVARFWADELHDLGIDVKSISGYELLKYYASGKLTTADIITRARRKAQEEYIDLRGNNWKERHKEQDEVRDSFIKNEI